MYFSYTVEFEAPSEMRRSDWRQIRNAVHIDLWLALWPKMWAQLQPKIEADLFPKLFAIYAGDPELQLACPHVLATLILRVEARVRRAFTELLDRMFGEHWDRLERQLSELLGNGLSSTSEIIELTWPVDDVVVDISNLIPDKAGTLGGARAQVLVEVKAWEPVGMVEVFTSIDREMNVGED